ncbi:MAG: hypothetical protein ABIA77_00605 [Candidatus Omnitrophota bacterium]
MYLRKYRTLFKTVIVASLSFFMINSVSSGLLTGWDTLPEKTSLQVQSIFKPILDAVGTQYKTQIRVEMAYILAMAFNDKDKPWHDMNGELDEWINAVPFSKHERIYAERLLEVVSGPIETGDGMEICIRLTGGPVRGKKFRIISTWKNINDIQQDGDGLRVEEIKDMGTVDLFRQRGEMHRKGKKNVTGPKALSDGDLPRFNERVKAVRDLWRKKNREYGLDLEFSGNDIQGLMDNDLKRTQIAAGLLPVVKWMSKKERSGRGIDGVMVLSRGADPIGWMLKKMIDEAHAGRYIEKKPFFMSEIIGTPDQLSLGSILINQMTCHEKGMRLDSRELGGLTDELLAIYDGLTKEVKTEVLRNIVYITRNLSREEAERLVIEPDDPEKFGDRFSSLIGDPDATLGGVVAVLGDVYLNRFRCDLNWKDRHPVRKDLSIKAFRPVLNRLFLNTGIGKALKGRDILVIDEWVETGGTLFMAKLAHGAVVPEGGLFFGLLMQNDCEGVIGMDALKENYGVDLSVAGFFSGRSKFDWLEYHGLGYSWKKELEERYFFNHREVLRINSENILKDGGLEPSYLRSLIFEEIKKKTAGKVPEELAAKVTGYLIRKHFSEEKIWGMFNTPWKTLAEEAVLRARLGDGFEQVISGVENALKEIISGKGEEDMDFPESAYLDYRSFHQRNIYKWVNDMRGLIKRVSEGWGLIRDTPVIRDLVHEYLSRDRDQEEETAYIDLIMLLLNRSLKTLPFLEFEFKEVPEAVQRRVKDMFENMEKKRYDAWDDVYGLLGMGIYDVKRAVVSTGCAPGEVNVTLERADGRVSDISLQTGNVEEAGKIPAEEGRSVPKAGPDPGEDIRRVEHDEKNVGKTIKETNRNGQRLFLRVSEYAGDITEGLMPEGKGTPIDIVVDLSLIPGEDIRENMETWAYLILLCSDMENVNFRFELPDPSGKGDIPETLSADIRHASGTERVLAELKKALDEKSVSFRPEVDVKKLFNTRINAGSSRDAIEIPVWNIEWLKWMREKNIELEDNQYPVALDGPTIGETGVALRNFEAAVIIGLVEAAIVIARRKDAERNDGAETEFMKLIFGKNIIGKMYDLYKVFRGDTDITEDTLRYMTHPASRVRLNRAIELALPPIIRMAVGSLKEYHGYIQSFLQAA